jgi:hypothetical protein
MADLNKFEQMLEKLVNEDKAGAEELFHEIVVEKSRDIYESLLEADLEVDEADEDEADDEEVDETTDEEVDESDEELDEDFNLDEFEVEADPMDAMMGDMEVDGGDEAPAMDMDMGDEEGEGDVEDRVEDLEDALDELKAEFEKMMSGDDEDEGGEEADDMDMDLGGDDEEEEAEEESMAFETTDEEVDEASDEEVEETAKSETETMREYVEKVNATMGDNGANTKSATATPNHMGDGTAANLAQGADEKGGKADAAKDMSTGNINVPGGKAAKASKPNAKGHGAEKKGAGETADNKKSTIGK